MAASSYAGSAATYTFSTLAENHIGNEIVGNGEKDTSFSHDELISIRDTLLENGIECNLYDMISFLPEGYRTECTPSLLHIPDGVRTVFKIDPKDV